MNKSEKIYTEIDYRAVGERIKSLRGLKSQEDFGKQFSLAQVDISRIERGEVKPTPELLYNICINYGKDFSWILIGKEMPWVAEPIVPYGDFVFISQVSGRIGAGGGLVPDNTIEMRIAFRRDWIQRKGSPKNMSLIRVAGDSMEPTLQSGDVVLIDHSRDYVDPHGGIYAIVMEDEIVLKRLQVLYPTRKIKVISDNSRYQPSEIEPDQIKINGKVIWFGRELER